MKRKIPLGNLLSMLPAAVRDSMLHTAKAEGHADPDKLQVLRVPHCEKAKTGDDLPPRTAVKRVSARTLDRDNEIVVPKGVDLAEFRKYMHVLWGHDYSKPPIGSDSDIRADDKGIVATTEYGDTGEGTLANVLWHLVDQGHQKASSIGFVPLAWTEPGHNDWDTVTRKLTRDWPEFAKHGAEPVRRVITKSVLLEHSDVSVPANADAEVMAVAKSLGADSDILHALEHNTFDEPKAKGAMPDIQELARAVLAELDNGRMQLYTLEPAHKAVIPYKDHGQAPAGTKWDGPATVAEADPVVLRVICAWYDADDGEMKSAYKLPHHEAGGGHRAVWKGVAAAMAALLGARGGVQIPAADRRGVYDHLAKHYAEFDRDPPELRSYVQGDLRKLFPDLYAPVVTVVKRRSVVAVKHAPTVRVLGKAQDTGEIVAAAVKRELARARGRLLE